MKTIGYWVAKIAVIALLVAVWFLYQKNIENEHLRVENQRLSLELAEVKRSLDELTLANQALEKKSVEGLLRETNKVVVSGWETLLNTVEKELDKAREMIQQKREASEEAERLDNAEREDEPPVIIQGERT